MNISLRFTDFFFQQSVKLFFLFFIVQNWVLKVKSFLKFLGWYFAPWIRIQEVKIFGSNGSWSLALVLKTINFGLLKTVNVIRLKPRIKSCPIHNNTFYTFVWPIMWKISSFSYSRTSWFCSIPYLFLLH